MASGIGKAFHHAASWTAKASGHWVAFLIALVVVVVWAVTGPFFQFSETWQLVINTGTTICTFLMVFLLAHAEETNTLALHVKLDELIVHLKGPRNELADIEEAEPEVLQRYRAELRALSEEEGTDD